MQMMTNDGNNEGLFRAAIVHSGSAIPVGDISHGQRYYDSLVEQTGCSGALDTLQCLRGVDYVRFKTVVDLFPPITSYQAS